MEKKNWASLAAADLAAIYEILADNHPGPVDDLNPSFKRWHQEGLHAALRMAREVKSAAGYYFNLKFYVAGFRDTHLNVSSNLALKPKWPGFVVAFRDGKFMTRGRRSPRTIKSAVVERETVSVRELMLRNVFPYAGNPALEASWVEFAPGLFIDLGNPWSERPSACVYDTGSVSRLRWRPIASGALAGIIEDAQFGPPPGFAMREFADNCVWVSLPTFRPRGEDVVALKQIIHSLPASRRARVIVFDVRGNTGGNSQWGSDLLRSLYGDPYYDSRLRTLHRRGTSAEWRVSEQNQQYIQRRAQEIEREFGRRSPIVRMMKTVARQMQRASRRGEIFCEHRGAEEAATAVRGRGPVNPVKAQVFLLTDGRCGSSCLDFADELLAMPSVKHVGFSTNADSGYADVRSEVLPSGISRLTFAMKVYRNHLRPPNVPYVVQHRWPGEMSDTAALERWILKLARRSAPAL